MAADIYRRGRLTDETSRELVDYITSCRDDVEIFDKIVEINVAHVIALLKAGAMTKEDASSLVRALLKADEGLLTEGIAMEDAHMAIEAFVIERAGKAGEYLNMGKSRNDQVAAAIRMRLRDYIVEIVDNSSKLVASLLQKSGEYRDAIMPGYTHLQPAQPTTLGYILMAHAEAIIRDLHRFVEAYNRVNLSPLGAAAMSGSTVRVSRYYLARLLGFKSLVDNTVDAVSSRDYMVEYLAALLSLSLEISKLSEHLILWSNPNLGYIELPDEYSSTSSIMPNKKNPVVAELARARAASPAAALVGISMILKSLPYSYNLDLQDATRYLWLASRDVLSTLRILPKLIDGMKADRDRMRLDARRTIVTASDLAEHLSMKHGIPFRTAHRIVGRLVKRAIEEDMEWGPGLKGILEEIAMGEGYEIDLDEGELSDVMDVGKAVERRRHVKLSGEEYILLLEELGARTRRILAWKDAVTEELKKSRTLLEERAGSMVRGG